MNDTTVPRPIPTLRTTTMTPLGEAVVLARRLGRVVADLDSIEDQIAVLALATRVARDLIAANAPPAA